MLTVRPKFTIVIEVVLVACLLITIFFIGQSFGSPTLFLLIGLSIYLVWHVYHLLIFLFFIQKKNHIPVELPTSLGVWREVFCAIQAYKKLEPSNSQTEQASKNSDKIYKDFIANVSHELKTPVTVIKGYLEAFEIHFKDNQDLMYSIKNMHSQTLRMNNIIEDLITISRLEQDNAIHQQHSIKVSVLIRSVVSDLKILNKEKHHQFKLFTDPDLELVANETELRSVFSNLINNAIKYTPAGGIIIIHWYKKRSKSIFSIQDDGIGIAKKHISRLTERFYRVDKSRGRESGGSGLGLAIVKHILSKYKAVLKIKSKPNKGSTFSCIFPL